MSVCGLPGALSVTLIVAVRAPAPPGVKVTLTTHAPVLAIRTKFAVHVVVPGTMAKSAEFVPVKVTGLAPARVAELPPVLVTVIVTGLPVVPCCWLPNGTGLGARATLAAPAKGAGPLVKFRTVVPPSPFQSETIMK